jgi:hypothetical protein
MQPYWIAGLVGLALIAGAAPITWLFFLDPIPTWVGWNVFVGAIFGAFVPFSAVVQLFHTRPQGLAAIIALLPLLGFLLVLLFGWPISSALGWELDTSDFIWEPIAMGCSWRGVIAAAVSAIAVMLAMAPVHARLYPSQVPRDASTGEPASSWGPAIFTAIIAVVVIVVVAGVLAYPWPGECYVVEDYRFQGHLFMPPDRVLLVVEDSNPLETSKIAKLIVPDGQNTVEPGRAAQIAGGYKLGFAVPRAVIEAGGLKYKVPGFRAYLIPAPVPMKKMSDLGK